VSEENPWKTLDSRLIYENAWIRVREDNVIRPDGAPGIYGVIETRVATGVLALTPENELYLVGQYRYPLHVYSWEIVEGGADRGEEPLDAAKRELREEAGLEAKSWRQLGGEVHLSNCFSAERGILYVARDLVEGACDPDATEVLTVRKVPLEEAERMVTAGEITDSMSMIGILLLARELRNG
jgi:8-oxo-dGTP pyrophosphatase MutT (NUDIX family)